MRPYSRALVQYDLCLYKKKGLEHRQQKWRDDHRRTQGKGGHLQAKETSKEIRFADPLISDMLPPEPEL